MQALPEALHAFLGAHESTANEDTKYHKVGNVGVEHAAPSVLQRVLSNARAARYGRQEFMRDDLEEWGLCGVMGKAPPAEWKAFGYALKTWLLEFVPLLGHRLPKWNIVSLHTNTHFFVLSSSVSVPL